jgi:hypothetical protein
MEQRVMWVSTQNLKNDTIIENNAEDFILKPCIYDAHIVDLQNLLGERFYKHLVTATLGGTRTADELTLTNTYMYNYLIKASLYRAIPYLWVKFENSSLVLKKNETSDSIEYKDMQSLRSDTLNDVAFLKQRLIDYLNKNIEKFPLFKDSVECDVLQPNTNNYSRIGLYL